MSQKQLSVPSSPTSPLSVLHSSTTNYNRIEMTALSQLILSKSVPRNLLRVVGFFWNWSIDIWCLGLLESSTWRNSLKKNRWSQLTIWDSPQRGSRSDLLQLQPQYKQSPSSWFLFQWIQSIWAMKTTFFLLKKRVLSDKEYFGDHSVEMNEVDGLNDMHWPLPMSKIALNRAISTIYFLTGPVDNTYLSWCLLNESIQEI